MRRRRSGEPASPTAESVQIPLSVHNSPILFCLSPPACATAFSLQFADPVSPLPASMRHGVRARVPSRTSHPVFRALATERRGPLVEPERSIPLRRALLIVRPEPRPRRCCSGEPGLPPPRPHSVLATERARWPAPTGGGAATDAPARIGLGLARAWARLGPGPSPGKLNIPAIESAANARRPSALGGQLTSPRAAAGAAARGRRAA